VLQTSFRTRPRKSAARPSLTGLAATWLFLVKNWHVYIFPCQFAGQYRNGPRDIGIRLDLEAVHGLQSLMIFLAENHFALGSLEAHALHRLDELLSVGGFCGLDCLDNSHSSSESAAGEKVRRHFEPLLMLLHKPIVYFVLGILVVVISGALHADQRFVQLQGIEDVPACCQLDPVLSFEFHVVELAQRIAL